MRGTVAKRIRKACYKDLAPRDRKHYRHKETGVVIADAHRHRFQIAKKTYIENDYDNDLKGKAKARKMIDRINKKAKAFEMKKINDMVH